MLHVSKISQLPTSQTWGPDASAEDQSSISVTHVVAHSPSGSILGGSMPALDSQTPRMHVVHTEVGKTLYTENNKSFK